jgi:hypothetical protein
MKLKPMTVVRGILLVSALAASSLVTTSRPAFAACVNGSNQWVYNGCCVNTTKYKGQSCIFGVWTDNGASMCSGVCRM